MGKILHGILLLYLNDPLYLFFLFSLENPNLELAIKHNPKWGIPGIFMSFLRKKGLLLEEME